jgi:tetratricopeptide (TPR) repeat protein
MEATLQSKAETITPPQWLDGQNAPAAAHSDPAIEAVRATERAGRFDEAAVEHAALVTARPNDVAVQCEAFWFHLRHDHHADAAQRAEWLTKTWPLSAEGYLFLGNVHMVMSDAGHAVDVYRAGLVQCPGTLELHRGLGDAGLEAGQLDTAVEGFHGALRVASRDPRSHCDMGRVREAQKRYADALQNYTRALAIDPAHLNSLMGAGTLHRDLRRFSEAREVVERALEFHPESPRVLGHLASIMLLCGEVEAARELFERTDAIAPDTPAVLSSLGGVELHAGRYREAGEKLKRAVELQPDAASNQFNYSLYLLTIGDFSAGWTAYEHGLETEQRKTQWLYPRWEGESAAGKTIFVAAEQGLGDEVMFASCLEDFIAKAKPSRCVVGCDRRLKPLFERSFDGIEFIDDPNYSGNAGLLPFEPIDAQVAIGSLPLHYRRSIDEFPRRKSFLKTNEGLRREHRARLDRLGGGLKIGISWRGGGVPLTKANRSIELAEWAPLLRTPATHFVNLQYGDSAENIDVAAERTGVRVCEVGVNVSADIDGLCALMAELDLIITIDNSTAHLAGAVGAPVWIILPGIPDWRWMLDREDTLWYESVRLVRRAMGEPAEVVMGQLSTLLAEMGHSSD